VKAIIHPLAPLIAMALVTAADLCAYVSIGRSPSPGVGLLLEFGWALMLVLWMDADARKLRRLPCYDFGMMVAIFFPLSLVWYCLWSRGWRGLLVLLMLLALFVVPYVIAAVLWGVLYAGG